MKSLCENKTCIREILNDMVLRLSLDKEIIRLTISEKCGMHGIEGSIVFAVMRSQPEISLPIGDFHFGTIIVMNEQSV